MERFNYDCAFDFAEELDGLADDGVDFTVIGSTDTIEELFKDMLALNDYKIMSVEFSKSYNEHVLEVDTNMNIYVYSYELGTRICDDIVYIESDCNSKIIKYCDCEEMIEFGFGEEEEECDGDCENCEFNGEWETFDDTDGVPGFIHTWSDEDGSTHTLSYFSTNREDLNEMIKNFFR